MNEDLNQAYILKDMLKQLWTYTYKACASKFLDRWIELAKETGIAELKRFAKGLDRAREGLAVILPSSYNQCEDRSFQWSHQTHYLQSLWLQ